MQGDRDRGAASASLGPSCATAPQVWGQAARQIMELSFPPSRTSSNSNSISGSANLTSDPGHPRCCCPPAACPRRPPELLVSGAATGVPCGCWFLAVVHPHHPPRRPAGGRCRRPDPVNVVAQAVGIHRHGHLLLQPRLPAVGLRGDRHHHRGGSGSAGADCRKAGSAARSLVWRRPWRLCSSRRLGLAGRPSRGPGHRAGKLHNLHHARSPPAAPPERGPPGPRRLLPHHCGAGLCGLLHPPLHHPPAGRGRPAAAGWLWAGAGTQRDAAGADPLLRGGGAGTAARRPPQLRLSHFAPGRGDVATE
mmetsp:Transcript_35100/g.99560  ORF Transcript_35100/g.99560 Transcript_35100/m.99560 type:complete len:307 (-) Transcript_35100:230-1150(-)